MSYFGIYRDIPDSQSSATIQPQTDFNRQVGTPSPTRSGEFNQSILLQEKSLDASLKNGHQWQYEHGQRTSLLSDSEDRRFKLRRFLLPAIVVFVTVALGGLLAWSRVSNMPAWGVDLTRRAALEERFTKLSGVGELAPLAHDLLNSNRDLFRSICGTTYRRYLCVCHSCGVFCCILS
jgi:hypothetical protein